MTAAAPDPSEGESDGATFEVRLVGALARALDREPLDLPPLARAVDVEALSSLAENGGTTVSFEYEGYEVEVGPDGGLSVAPSNDGRSSGGVARSDADADAA